MPIARPALTLASRIVLAGWASLARVGREGLVAELTGALTCATLGITPAVRHAD
jgi:antirestriction protein ArdC